MDPAASSRRRKDTTRWLPLAATGRPAPFRLGAPGYLAALGGWVAASVLLLASASELVWTTVSDATVVAAAHTIGLVVFPFAVAAAVWQLVPVMLRNDPRRPWTRWVALVLLASGAPLAAAVAAGRERLVVIFAVLLGTGLLLLLVELAGLIRGAPPGRTLVVNRSAVAIAAAHAAAAFGLGVVVFAVGGPEPLGVPYERLLLVHVLLALVGWLTVLIAAVGRTLVPMLGLAASAPLRTVPVAELGLVAGLWVAVAGLVASVDALLVLGVVLALAGLSVPARIFLRVARTGTIGAREGPGAHVTLGLVFVLQAAVLALLAGAGWIEGRRAAVAAVLLLGVGWAVGTILGHLGKLISLSAWGSWPPGPRPKQAELYPRRGWQAEVVLFGAGVQLLAVGVMDESVSVARGGGVLIVLSALTALACGVETVRRAARGLASHALQSKAPWEP